MGDKIHVCRCGTEFVFRKHETSNRLAPIEVEPAANGTVEVLPNGRYRIGPAGDGPRFKSHFATCPHASGFRRD
jgi:hypothetical protein